MASAQGQHADKQQRQSWGWLYESHHPPDVQVTVISNHFGMLSVHSCNVNVVGRIHVHVYGTCMRVESRKLIWV